ncbi:MAG: DUF503 domain-containing protein [Bacillota bacterium]
MFVGVLTVDLFLPGAASLKDRRRVLRGLLDRLRNRYNVASAEVGGNGSWKAVTVGIVTISNSAGHVERLLARVLQYIEAIPEIEVTSHLLEVW